MDIIKNIIYTLLSFIFSYGTIVMYMFCIPKTLHYMQLEGYKNSDFMRWFTKNPKLAFKSNLKQLIAVGGYYLVITLINNFMLSKVDINSAVLIFIVEYIAMLIVFFVVNIFGVLRDKKERKKAKKPLVYTARAKRLIFWNFITVALLEVSFLGNFNDLNIITYQMLKTLCYSLFIFVLPINMLIANFLASPTETFVSNRYINSTRRKLNKKAYKNLIKIGITGSYGKTSTKFILETILNEKYNVLATPESYNTTMGNVKTIREKLKPEHEVFISEMGARYRFDIQEICNFVKPQIGIITSIGPQHLESFKNIDNIVKTKSELLAGLTDDGVVFLPNDDSHCLKLYNKEKRKKYIYGINDKHADVYAKNIKLNSNGCEFTAVTKNGEIKCVSKLLGEHNIQNILGCISIAIHLGLSNEQIASGVSKIEPIEHRLQILPNSNGITVIDDAFNSNPVGSKMALDVLKQFDGRKIIITPGMVELGKDEYKYNKEFGRHMAEVIDIAILVGVKRSEPIVNGLKEGEFNDMNIYVVENLDAATKKLNELSRIGDVVLFENDLPDNYNE